MVRFFTHSEVGGHAENEDAFGVYPHPVEAGCYLCAIADGQGGQVGGRQAARLACASCLEATSAIPHSKFINPATWTGILKKVDQDVAAKPAAGFTTLAAFGIVDGLICGASNGDSAVVYWSARQQLENLTACQRKNPPIGSGESQPIAFHSVLQPPWVVLAMTDGVWKYTGWNVIRDMASRVCPAEIIGCLLQRARLPRSGKLQDDFTLLVFSDS